MTTALEQKKWRMALSLSSILAIMEPGKFHTAIVGLRLGELFIHGSVASIVYNEKSWVGVLNIECPANVQVIHRCVLQ